MAGDDWVHTVEEEEEQPADAMHQHADEEENDQEVREYLRGPDALQIALPEEESP